MKTVWRVMNEGILLSGGGRRLLLKNHPFVAIYGRLIPAFA